MAKIYAELIRKGLKTIDDVPEKLKAAVQAIWSFRAGQRLVNIAALISV
jgi:hypothetical protein